MNHMYLGKVYFKKFNIFTGPWNFSFQTLFQYLHEKCIFVILAVFTLEMAIYKCVECEARLGWADHAGAILVHGYISVWNWTNFKANFPHKPFMKPTTQPPPFIFSRILNIHISMFQGEKNIYKQYFPIKFLAATFLNQELFIVLSFIYYTAARYLT